MKHKYTIFRDQEKDQLILREYGELDKEMMSFLCEASYSDKAIREAIEKDKNALVDTLRTENMYPPNLYADKIADAVIMIYDDNQEAQSTEIIFDDLDWLTKDQEVYIFEEDIGDDNKEDEIDDLLEDDFEEEFDESDELKLDSPLKIDDDDAGDYEEES